MAKVFFESRKAWWQIFSLFRRIKRLIVESVFFDGEDQAGRMRFDNAPYVVFGVFLNSCKCSESGGGRNSINRGGLYNVTVVVLSAGVFCFFIGAFTPFVFSFFRY